MRLIPVLRLSTGAPSDVVLECSHCNPRQFKHLQFGNRLLPICRLVVLRTRMTPAHLTAAVDIPSNRIRVLASISHQLHGPFGQAAPRCRSAYEYAPDRVIPHGGPRYPTTVNHCPAVILRRAVARTCRAVAVVARTARASTTRSIPPLRSDQDGSVQVPPRSRT